MANGTIAFDTLSTSGQITGTAKSLDTDYVVNGSAKSFEIHDDDTTTLKESFNMSSITDGSQGVCSPVFANNMATVNYFTAASAGNVDTSFGVCSSVRYGAALSTSTYTYVIVNSGNAVSDRENTMSCNHGDLA